MSSVAAAAPQLIALAQLSDDGVVAPGGRLVADESDGLLCIDCLTAAAMELIMQRMLFALPSGHRRLSSGRVVELSYLPNPRNRFCLDLRATLAHQWFASRKVRKHGSEFRLVVKTDMRAELHAALEYHTQRAGDTWLTAPFIDVLQEVSSTRRSAVQCYCFALVEKATGATAAACFGFARGRVYQDFTMYTPMRDVRSCGPMLSRIVGGVLHQLGVELWYWGYRCPYMDEYVAFGARDVGRDEFFALLATGQDMPLPALSTAALPAPLEMHIECT